MYPDLQEVDGNLDYYYYYFAFFLKNNLYSFFNNLIKTCKKI